MNPLKIDAVYLTVKEASYTSKKTDKLIEYRELQVLVNNAIQKWSFRNVSHQFDWSVFSKMQSGTPIKLHVVVSSDSFDHDKPFLQLVAIT